MYTSCTLWDDGNAHGEEDQRQVERSIMFEYFSLAFPYWNKECRPHFVCQHRHRRARARNNIDRRSSNEHKKSQFLLIDFSGSWARRRRSSRCVNNSNDFSLCRRFFFGVSSCFFSHVRASRKVPRNRLKFSPQFLVCFYLLRKKFIFRKSVYYINLWGVQPYCRAVSCSRAPHWSTCFGCSARFSFRIVSFFSWMNAICEIRGWMIGVDDVNFIRILTNYIIYKIQLKLTPMLSLHSSEYNKIPKTVSERSDQFCGTNLHSTCTCSLHRWLPPASPVAWSKSLCWSSSFTSPNAIASISPTPSWTSSIRSMWKRFSPIGDNNRRPPLLRVTAINSTMALRRRQTLTFTQQRRMHSSTLTTTRINSRRRIIIIGIVRRCPSKGKLWWNTTTRRWFHRHDMPMRICSATCMPTRAIRF